MVQLFCVIVGAQGSAFPVDIDASQFVVDLKYAIQEKKKLTITCVASKLQLFQAKTENGDGWLSSDDDAVIAMRTGAISGQVKRLLKDEIDPAEEIGDKFRNAPTKKTVHVLVVVPEVAAGSPLLQSEYSAAFSNIAWYGKRGSTVDGEGVNLKDPRTLSRDILTADIIRQLKEKNVLLVKSPPMTGKTSLAALVSRSLMDRHIIDNEKVNVFNFTALGRYEDETFEELFKRQCQIDWKDAVATFPAKSDCMVYLVVDEVQVIYREGDRRNSSSFWEMTKSVLSDENSRLRILMFAAYGSRLEYRQRVKLEDDAILDTNWLGFTHAEVSEYVQKWFKGITCFERSSLSAMEEFCSSLEELTGGHVGLCMTTIRELNKVYDSNIRSASHQPLPAKWIRMLQTGSLYRENDSVLFDALTSTRAVSVLNTLGKIELDELGRIAYGVACDFDAGVVEQCLRKGILVQTECAERRFEFSSPVMWRFFVKLSVRDLVRALHAPNTLPEMIARVMRAIDYDSIRNTLGRSLASDSPLERAWQMEFYKAVYRCTPSTFKTSADVVALFGSSGYVDFTVHEGDNLWGIELLREASNLSEHIERFSPGGRYSAVPFTDFCLVDFRRVDSIDDVPIKGIAKNMCDCDKLVMTQKWQVLWRLIPQWLSSTGLHLSSLQREYDFLNLVAALDANVQKIEVK